MTRGPLSPPERGEGWGEGRGRLAASAAQRLPPLQRRQDRLQDPVDAAVNFVIVEASHAVASIAQGVLSHVVATAFAVGRMRRAVDLDDKLCFAANEVGEIGADRLLPDELETAETAVPESPPELTFSLGLVLPQPAGSARFMQA